MTVAHRDGDDAAEQVQIAPAGRVVQPLHVAAVQQRRPSVGGVTHPRAEVALAQLLDGGDGQRRLFGVGDVDLVRGGRRRRRGRDDEAAAAARRARDESPN